MQAASIMSRHSSKTLVAVVGVGHVGGRARGGIEGSEQDEAIGVGAEAAQSLSMPAVEGDHEVDRREL